MTNDVLRELEAELRRELTELNQAVYEHNDGCPAQNRAIAARDKVKARLDAISALLREREWRPIETAPKDGTTIIICDPVHNVVSDRVQTGFWNDVLNEWQLIGEYVSRRYKPTKWLPLPIPTEEPEK